MFTHKARKAVPGKVNRSDFRRLVIPGLHWNRAGETERDIIGAGVVVLFTGGVVCLMRIVLAH